MTNDYLGYYDLETYLFQDVAARFHREQKLDAFDLFSIIIWKANRAKSKIARRLTRTGAGLEEAAAKLTQALAAAKESRQRLLVLMKEGGFQLPMATAILSVLWPDHFTVYDTRVCQELQQDFHRLASKSADDVWPDYLRYRQAVIDAVPEQPHLRDKDRVLWARSAARQLVQDIAQGFPKADSPRAKTQF